MARQGLQHEFPRRILFYILNIADQHLILVVEQVAQAVLRHRAFQPLHPFRYRPFHPLIPVPRRHLAVYLDFALDLHRLVRPHCYRRQCCRVDLLDRRLLRLDLRSLRPLNQDHRLADPRSPDRL